MNRILRTLVFSYVLLIVAIVLFSLGSVAHALPTVVLFPGAGAGIQTPFPLPVPPAGTVTATHAAPIAIPGGGGATFEGSVSRTGFNRFFGIQGGYSLNFIIRNPTANTINTLANPILLFEDQWGADDSPVWQFGCGLCPEMVVSFRGQLKTNNPNTGINLVGGEQFALAFTAFPSAFGSSFSIAQFLAPPNATNARDVPVQSTQTSFIELRPTQNNNLTLRGFMGFVLGPQEQFTIGVVETRTDRCEQPCFPPGTPVVLVSEPVTLGIFGAAILFLLWRSRPRGRIGAAT